jgi:DNA-binding NarL/FixJ family response regulator
MIPTALAIIAAPPDFLRYSLQALLARLPQIDEVRGAADIRSLLAAPTDMRLRLVVLDADLLRGEAGPVLAQIKATAPQARLVVLVDRIDQQQALQATVADRVLLKGYPAAELFASMEQLLVQADRDDEQLPADGE